MRNLFRVRLLFIGLAIATGWSCTETIVGIVDIASLEIEPATTSVYIGADVALQARIKDDRGNTLSGRQLDWSSEQPQIATVNAGGVVHGVSEGTADIVASSEGVRKTARVTVMPRPIIDIEPDSVVFTLVQGGLPAPDTIVITNTGGGALDRMSVAVQYDGDVTGWLGTNLSAADAPASLALAPAADDLEPGTYRASVRIMSPDAANTPLSFSVRLDLLRAQPASMVIANGDGQTAIAGTMVSSPVAVLVSDANGNPLEGAAVTFAVVSGGGSLTDDAPVLTDASGHAVAPPWTLGVLAGTNTMKATVDGLAGDSLIITATAIAGAPAQLTITTEPSASAASGAAFVRQPVVQLRDVGGNAVSEAGVTVTASIATGGGVLDGTVSIATGADGTARFTDLAITGSVGERTLEFTSDRLTSATSAAIAITTGAGTQFAIVTQPSSAAPSGVAFERQPSLQLQDAGGNAVSQAGILVTVSIASGGGTLGGTVTATTNAKGAASFADLHITGTIGDRTLRFMASGITAATSEAIAVTLGPASPAHSDAAVGDGIAGDATSISITLRDGGGNPITGAAARLAVSITGANTASPSVSETDSGTYAASYTPSATGTDEVAITIDGEAIAGSPFISTITPAGVSVSNSSVTLSPTGSVTADGQDSVAVTVVLRDAIGNPIGGLASSIQVTLSGSASAGAVAETSTTGTYMFNLTSTVANLVGIALTVGGTALSDEPTVEFVPGAIAVESSAVGASPARGVLANGLAPSTVTVTLADAFMNPVTGLTNANFGVAFSTANPERSEVTESGSPGTYTFTVTNTVAEEVVVTVTAGGITLTQTATIEFVAGAISTSSAVLADPSTGLTAGVDTSTVTVTLVDDNGNPISGMAALFSITGTGSSVRGTVSEPSSGTYTFPVTDAVAETETLTITVDGVQLTTQPTIEFVPGAISSAESTAAASPATGVTADSTTASTVTVMVKDENGNTIAGVAAGEFTITLTGSAAPGTISETTTPGTYTFTVVNTVAETVTVTVTARLVQLAQQPTIEFVAGAVDAGNSTVTASPTQVTTGN